MRSCSSAASSCSCGSQALIASSVGNRHLRALMSRRLHFVDKSIGLIFGADAAVAVLVRQDGGGTEPILAGTLSRCDRKCRAEESPVDIAGLQRVEYRAHRLRFAAVGGRQRVGDWPAVGQAEAARAADDNEALAGGARRRDRRVADGLGLLERIAAAAR